jgi:hypothetical protein
MKRLITIAGLVLSFACQPFASERAALARVTVYLAKVQVNPRLGMAHG